MKRQSNIVAAALNNYERLDEILKISQQSAGSAMREQEEYAKSIQYSIDTLKASYQDLSQTVIKSDFVKTLLSGAQEFLEVLTAIIDKFGAFPTLLASIGAVGSFNKMGFFKVVEDDATKGGNAVALFGKKLKDVIKDYQEADAGRIGENKFSQAFSGIIGFNQSDLSAIEKYNSLIESGVDKTEAFEKSMVGVSNGAKSFVQSSKTATVGITGLSISEKVATIATDALGVALNTALSFGVGLLIQAIITGITKLVNAEKEAQEKAEELRKKATETAKSYKDEVESLSNLTSEYIKLATTTSDLSTQKEKLLDIQGKINDGFASEKEKVDLLNGSLSENIRLLDEQEYKEAKKTISDLEPQYEEFQKLSNKEGNYFLLNDKDKKNAKDVAKNIEREFVDFFNATTDYYEAEWIDAFTGEQKSAYVDILSLRQPLDEISVAGQSYAEVLDNLNLIIDSYREWEGHNNNTLESLNALRDKYDELAQSENEVTTAYETAQKSIQDYNDAFNSDASQRISEILEDAKELSTTLSSSKSGAEKYSAIQQLESLENEARQLAGTNTVLKNNIDIVFSAINDGSQTAIKSVEDLHSAWFESLDEMQKGALKNIDTMKTALQNISDGKLLSSTDFWELSKFDENHILDGAKMIGDQFKVTEEQLIQLKDVYIRKQIEQLQIQNQSLQDQIDGTNGVNDGLKEQLELQLAILQAQIAKGVNSAGDAKIIEKQKAKINSIKKSIRAYNDDINRNNILIKQLNANLGNTANLLQSAEERAKKLQENADKLSNAYMERIDSVIDGINEEKDALNNEKKVLQDQLDILEAQADEIKGIIEDYEKVADVVKETIEEEISAIEETYNKQIEALKAQNDEREEAIDLTEKLNALNNAKNNKVVTYTEAGGFRYGVNKEAVNKAQNDYDKALLDSQISNLEKERDSATKELEEYAKLRENATKKATKAEEEELATRILGADWREKISEQDVEIFDTYQKKYDEYGVSLKRITDVEIANVKKSIDAKDKEIKAKEELLAEWQKYKSNVQKWVNDLKDANQDYADSLDGITLTESSNLDERLSNFETFKDKYMSIIDEIENAQKNIGDIEVNASINAEGFTDGLSELVDGIGTVSEKLAEAIKELGKMPSINSAGDVKYYHATGYEHYASGGVNSSTGLAWLDGTKNRPELVLNNSDATKLYNMLHSMPMSAVQMYTSPFVNTKSGGANQPSTIQISGNTINLPNVQNPQQFAREMERYLQNTLTESQIIPPRK